MKELYGKRNRIVEAFEQWLAPLFLFLYPLRHVQIGIDLTDTGYSLGNFLFFEQLEGMWLYATYLANVMGNLLMKLPFGNTMRGMNLYTSLFISVIALLAFYFLKTKIPVWIVFLGEILAISLCWTPSVILYNYITYLGFTLAVLLLYKALTKEKNDCFVLAGVVIGINMFARFSNLVETALILSVWYYGYLRKKEIKKVVQETALCLVGFIVGLIGMLFVIIIQYGPTGYLQMLQSLVGLAGGGGGGDYSLAAMLFAIFDAYRTAFGWSLYYFAFVFAFLLFAMILPKKNRMITIGKWSLFAIGHLFLLRFLWGRGMFSLNYFVYDSMLQWVTLFIFASMLVFVWMLFDKTQTQEEKLLASMLLILSLVTSLGSNNYIYANINSLFLVAPLGLWGLWRMITVLWNKTDTILIWKKRMPIDGKLLAATLSVVIAITLVQSICFGANFVFRDGEPGSKRDSRVENNEVLQGMYTSKERAAYLSELTAFAKEENIIGKSVILYDGIPGVSYFLQMPSYLTSSYPDMESFEPKKFAKEIEPLFTRDFTNMEKPVIIVSGSLGAFIEEDVEGMNYLGVTEDKIEQYRQDEKVEMLKSLLEELKYQNTFANGQFFVYQAK